MYIFLHTYRFFRNDCVDLLYLKASHCNTFELIKLLWKCKKCRTFAEQLLKELFPSLSDACEKPKQKKINDVYNYYRLRIK